MKRVVSKKVFVDALHPFADEKLLKTVPEIVGISIDTRSLAFGDVFIAMRGDEKDGHDFIDDASAASLIIAEKSSSAQHSNLVIVPNSLDFFMRLARIHLQSLSLTKIAVTGSNGKTTTKEMIKAALEGVVDKDKIFASAGNRNNHFGVPLSALEVSKQHRYAIFEMGMNHSQEIERLCSIVEPHVGVITNIGVAHVGNFVDGIDGIAKAKGELFAYLAHHDGHAIVNLDDERVVEMAELHNVKKRCSFGRNTSADVVLLEEQPFSLTEGVQTLTLLARGEEKIKCAIPLPGSHHATNAACALALIKALGMSLEMAARNLRTMTKTTGRMTVDKCPRGYLMINDGYNANPHSMRAGILASLDIPAKRRIAAIGAMGELGSMSAELHFDIGTFLARHFDHVLVCGLDGRYIVDGLLEAGMPKDRVTYLSSSLDLIQPLKSLLEEGDLIFIKGSLSANMQAIARELSLT